MTATNKVLIFDLDDCFVNTKTRIQNIYRKYLGRKDIHYRDWTDINLEDRYDVSWDKLKELMIEDNTFQLVRPHLGASEITKYVKNQGYYIVFVTARGWHPDAKAETEKYLKDNDFVYDELIITELNQSKEEATRHLSNIVLFVEDNFDNALEFANSKRADKTILYRQNWNKFRYKETVTEEQKNEFILVDDIREVLRFI